MYSTRLYSPAVKNESKIQDNACYAWLRADQRASRRAVALQVRSKRRDAAILFAFLITLFVALVFVFNPAPSAIADSQQSLEQCQPYQIASGDTLWSIASDHPMHGLSTQDNVHWLMELNGLTSANLVVGQVILVSAP